MLNFLKQTDEGTIITVKLAPNASRNEVVGFCDEYLKIKTTAPSIENKANKSAIEFLSDFFKVPKSRITIVSGEKSKLKRFLLKSSFSKSATTDFEKICNKISVCVKLDEQP